MNLWKLAMFLCWFFFLLRCKSFHKIEICYLIALKFGAQKGSILTHHNTKLGCNSINSHEVINDYSQKIAPICYHIHAYKVNKKWQGDRLTIEPQTFCWLKRKRAKNHEGTAKNPAVGKNYTQLRFTDKIDLMQNSLKFTWIIKFLPSPYHHSHFLVATLDFTIFLQWLSWWSHTFL